jgi:peptidoglycan/LPS O-acetylase OafA/YrhL
LDGRTASSSNHRATFAALLGILSALTIPAAVAVAQRSRGIRLIDAAWGIPVALALGFLALGASNLARARIQRTLGRAGGEGRARTARLLGAIGICLAVTAAISVGFYELLLHFEK